MLAEYRIVTDNFAGFEVQIRTWWWPFWTQCDFINTRPSVESAEQFAIEHAKARSRSRSRSRRRVVKVLGRIDITKT